MIIQAFVQDLFVGNEPTQTVWQVSLRGPKYRLRHVGQSSLANVDVNERRAC
jgi:hypothetical protein